MGEIVDLIYAFIEIGDLEDDEFGGWRLLPILHLPVIILLDEHVPSRDLLGGGDLPLLGHNLGEPIQVAGDDLHRRPDTEAVHIEVESVCEVQVVLASPFEEVEEFGAVHFLVEYQVRGQLGDVELEVLPSAAVVRVDPHFLHHFAVELPVFDEQGHQHVEGLHLLVPAD